MPHILIDTGTQMQETYINGENEGVYMHALAEMLEPLLDLAGILYTRAEMEYSAARSEEEAYDLCLVLRTNAASPQYAGMFQGPLLQYRRGDQRGHKACEAVAERLRTVYYSPALPSVQEITQPERGCACETPQADVLLAYRDNSRDVRWMQQCKPQIADALAAAVASYLDCPFAREDGKSVGRVCANGAALAVHSAPNTNAAVVARARDGERLAILRRLPGWFQVEGCGKSGYVSSQYLEC